MRTLDPHQVVACNLIQGHQGIYGLACAPGTGKTIVAIRCSLTPCLVICRRDDFLTWRDELQMEGVPRVKLHFMDYGKVWLPPLILSGRWYFITYDLLKNKRIFEWVKKQAFSQVIWDEFHLCKHWSAKRTKANFKATRHIPRRLGLTGSAITNEPSDVFATSLLLDNGRTFGDNEWKFRNRYYIQSGPGWYPKRDSIYEIKKKMQALWYYVHEDDVLDLPPCRPVVKGVPMTGMQRRHYESILTEWETQLLSGETVEMDQVIVQMAKLRQIAGGFIYDRPGHAVWLRNNKVPLLFQLIEEYNKPKVIVWCSHTAEIERIANEADNKDILNVTFYGGISAKNRVLARQSFRDNPKIRLFIGQVDAGLGMNELTVADTAIWYSNSLKVVSKQQSQRRNRRRGSEIHERIYHVDLCTEHTLDFKLAKSIRGAMSLAHEILSACRAGESPRKYLT